MKNSIIHCLSLSLTFLLCPAINAEMDKSEAILEELRTLNQSVNRLEERVAQLEEGIVESSSERLVESRESSDNSSTSLVQRVAEAVQLREQKANYPWMDDSLWAKIETGMSEEAVIAVLGEPSLDEPSLHKRVDKVYTYLGRRAVTNEKVVGKIKFQRGSVTEIEAP